MTPRDPRQVLPPRAERPLSDPLTARVLPFRRAAVKPRRKRRSLLVTLWRPLLGSLALVGLPVGVAVWMLTSPRFALSRLSIEGTGRVPAAWVRQRLSPLLGKNLVLLPLSWVIRSLGDHPWIEGVAVDKRLPDGLRVVVTERHPAALVEEEGRIYFADASGRRIAPAGPEAGRLGGGRLLVVAGAGRDPEGVARALAAAAELARVEPVWGEGLVEIEVLGEEDFRLHLRNLPFPILVRAGDIGPKVRRLQALLPRFEAQGEEPAAVDLRFRRRIVVKPPGRPRGGA